MVHASYAVFPIMLLIGYFSQNFKNPLIVMFCISWVFSIIAEDVQIQLFANIDLPYVIGKKVEYYSDQEYIQNLYQGTGFNWVGVLFKTIVRHYVNFLILLITLNEKHINNGKAIPVVRFMLVLATIANFGMFIPTFGRRFFVVNYALVAYSFLVTFGDYRYRKLVYALPFVWFMNLFFLYRDVTAVLDFGFVLTPLFSFVRYLFVV